MATDSESAVLIGFIVTIVIVGLAGGVALFVFICIKYREYKKRCELNSAQLRSRQRSRRRSRHVRVRPVVGNNASNNRGPATIELPPAYVEVDHDPPPPYTAIGLLASHPHLRPEAGGTRGSITGTLSPIPQGRPLARNQSFGVHINHINTGTTNTPMVTPVGSMFRSSIPNTRDHSASSHARSMNMVHIEPDHHDHHNNTMNLALNIHVDNSNNSSENG